MAALLDSFSSDDWSELSIDPVQTDAKAQKVDIEWALKDGRLRVAQVKHSINNIEVPDAKRWASELRRSRKADEYKLMLYAPTTGGVPKLGSHDGVNIEVHQGELPLLWDALTLRTLKFIRRRKYAEIAVTQAAIRLLVGRTITGVTERVTWTRASLEDLLIQLIESYERRHLVNGPRLGISLLRVIRNATHGRSDEFVRYSFSNTNSVPVTLPGWSVRWTDSDSIKIKRVWETGFGHPAYYEVTYDATNTFELVVCPTTTIPPGGSGAIEICLTRSALIEQLGSPPRTVWSFNDPLLPTDSPHETDIYVIFPHEGSLTASMPCVFDARIVHWQLITGAAQRRLTAVMQAGAPSLPTDQELLTELEGYFTSHL